MGQGARTVAGLAAGFVGGCLGGFLVASPSAEAPVGGGPASIAAKGASEEGAPREASLARLEGRLAALESAVRPGRATEGERPADAAPGEESGAARVDGAGARGASEAPSAEGRAASAGVPTLADLARRIELLERGRKPATMIPEDLAHLPATEAIALLRSLSGEKRWDDALRVADALAQRSDLSVGERADIDLNAGWALRSLGRHTDAETRFREILGRVGEDSEKGAEVGFQLGWERYYQKDPAGAADRMERTADSASVSAVVRVHSLYNAGRFAKESGDTDRARRLLERLLRDHGDDIPASQQFLRTETERMLKELSGG